MKHRIYVVGMGPGQENMMTQEAMQVLEASDVIIGYTVYLKLLGERFGCKELLSTPMRQERERCQMCFEKAREGKKVALICSGDAGIYGMASLMLEIGKLYDDCIIEVIPGITAASSGAAVLGAPLNHDFCVISLSDLLTPWERIKKRLIAAAEGDFAMAIYNPSSHKRADYLERACRILMEHGVEPERACGYVHETVKLLKQHTEQKRYGETENQFHRGTAGQFFCCTSCHNDLLLLYFKQNCKC